MLFALMVMTGSVVSVTQAGAAMVERSGDIEKPMPKTYGTMSTGSGRHVDGHRPGAVPDIGQGALVSIRFLNTAWDTAVPQATGSHGGFLSPTDPLGLWGVECVETASGGSAPFARTPRIREDLPVIVSAAAVMVTSVLGWRLIAPPLPQRRNKKRRRKSSSSGAGGADDATRVGDVIRYIAESITPRFLKRRKRSRRRASSTRGQSADNVETIIGDAARAIVETVTPQRRHRKRGRKSRRSRAMQRDMRPT